MKRHRPKTPYFLGMSAPDTKLFFMGKKNSLSDLTFKNLTEYQQFYGEISPVNKLVTDFADTADCVSLSARSACIRCGWKLSCNDYGIVNHQKKREKNIDAAYQLKLLTHRS